ncbi:hypothetical protein NFI96_006058 [Prochilodus magdalenae]|nr:hypothetical protein NFI96_006058 [Prochilodus magdalenae]
MAKRKKDEEYRTFQEEWTEEFAFVERAGSAVCLICNDKIASMKRSNIKRHFDTRHTTFASKYPAGDSRKKACQELLCRVQASQQQLRVWTQQGDWNSASFAGALAIVRNGKPFTDGEYAKTFMLDVANELFDDFSDKDKIIKRIKDMPLSARTVHDRTIMMANQIEATQVKDINAAPFFSLALDESTDVSHLSQFSVIARYVVGDTVREESLAVLPMKGTTRGEDLFKSFTEFAKEKNLPMDKLISVCTDGAPCMVGKNRGFVALLREYEKRPILSFHCILHQEALCAQMCGEQLGEVMSLVIQVVNFIVARALNDRQFKTLLDEVGNNYPGLLLHSNVRWLSRGKYESPVTETPLVVCSSSTSTSNSWDWIGHGQGSVLWGSVLWAASCGQCPVGRVLWAASCGQLPVGSVLWAVSCGQRPVGQRPVGQRPVSTDEGLEDDQHCTVQQQMSYRL